MLLSLIANKKLCPKTRIIPYEDYACVAQSEALINDAKNKAKKIIQQANMQADLIIKDAQDTYESEKARGFNDGMEESHKKQTVMLFNMLSGGINYLSNLQQILIHTVQTSVEKIIGEYPPEERIELLVKNALKSVPNGKFLKIHVHQDQAVLLKKHIKELSNIQPGLERIEIEINKNMQLDQCILETETGILDASLEMQLSTLIKAIQSVLH